MLLIKQPSSAQALWTFQHWHKVELLYAIRAKVTPFTRIGRQCHEPINDFWLAPIHHAGECFFRCGGDGDLVDVGHEEPHNPLVNVMPSAW